MDGYNPLILRDDDTFLILDQRELPWKKVYIEVKNVNDVCRAIKDMAVRGAPLIGITAAIGLYFGVRDSESWDEFEKNFNYSYDCLSKTRPTAVNLFFALEKLKDVKDEKKHVLPLHKLIKKLRATAIGIWEDQKEQDKRIGEFGSEYLKGKRRILTHCNTGTLATGGIGTALGIIKTMHKKDLLDVVYVDETRPYLQGMRLTAFELKSEGIDYRIVTDNSCGMLIREGLVDAVVVGADRIARNGDTANKIGTYCLASMCKRHGITFVVAAPESTIDRSLESLNQIPVEERSAEEVLKIGDKYFAPKGSSAVYYSFDLTDAELIDAIITEKGVYKYPYRF